MSAVTTMSPAPATAMRRWKGAGLPLEGFRQRAAQAGVSVDEPLVWGALHVDPALYEVHRGRELLDLSPRQVELLALFLAAPSRVWTREQLHWVGWGEAGSSRRVDVQLCRVRGKVDADLFRNVRDRGWILRPPH